MSLVALAGAALAFGVGSALVPVLNAEAYAVVGASRSEAVVAATIVLALAVGQTLGKLCLFETARRGASRLGHARDDAAAQARWGVRVRGWLSRRRTGLPLVLASAAVGVPPLALVSVAAGASGQRHAEFGLACLAGRVVRFAVLVVPALALAT